MMNSSYNNNNNSRNGPRSKCDQVIFEALAKCCEVVVGSRTTRLHNSHPTNTNMNHRFHLSQPELAGIRNILTKYRSNIHVPLSLDVYYEQTDGRRELLERWHLEYSLSNLERFLQVEQMVSINDPMLQLTHVCKRIVVFLRTLYCQCRLLPCHYVLKSDPNVGFSLYAGNERDTHTVPDGFVWHTTTSSRNNNNTTGTSSVVTPYGELTWKVQYLADLKKYQKPSTTVVRIQTPSVPIPIRRHNNHKTNHRPSAQSAPHHHMAAAQATNNNNTNQLLSYAERSAQQHQVLLATGGKSLDPKMVMLPTLQSQQQQQYHHPGMFQRQHSSIGAPKSQKNNNKSIVPPQEQQPPVPPASGPPPGRVLSGLSLALMQAEEETTSSSASSPKQQQQQPSSEEQEHVRQAIFHSVPPHESAYGYGYNNHIPWQSIHPSSNVAGADDTTTVMSQSPKTPAFLGTTPPAISHKQVAVAATPPFPHRPAGFLVDPQVHPPTMTATTTATESNSSSRLKPPPLRTSLDSLRSSPFAQQSSLSVPLNGASYYLPSLAGGHNNDESHHNDHDMRTSGFLQYKTAASSSVLPSSLWQSHNHHPLDAHSSDLYHLEDMPFAVDDGSMVDGGGNTSTNSKSSTHLSSSAKSSSALATLAQKCAAPNPKLSLCSEKGADVGVSSTLADQLNEFRTFGASLHVPQKTTADDTLRGSSSSSATPISLRS